MAEIEKDHKICGERVYLRPITLLDTDLIIKWRNSESVKKYFIYREPFTHEGHNKWLKEQVETKNAYQFIVCKIENDKPIGCTYLRDIDRNDRKAEYGVFIGEVTDRGKGIGKEALSLTLNFAFEELKLHKVFARALSDNEASIHCFLQSGFTKEALLRDDVFVDEEFHDIVLVGILQSDYEMRRENL